MRRTLEHRGSIFQTTSDTEVIVHLVARSQARNLSGALADALNQVEGAYSLLVLTRDEMYALRDPRGFRPLALGQLDGAWVVASETCAFDLIGATYVRDVEPGEMLRITRTGIESLHFAAEKPLQQCIFEHVYFARPDSLVFGRVVEQSREMLGRLLAREHHVPADIVVPVPDSGVPAAVGYSQESGVPFRMGLIRNHYVGRTFIEPLQSIRDFGVKLKLNPVPEIARAASAWCWWTIPSCAAQPAARSCAWCAKPARRKCTCASVARRRFRPATTAWTRRRARN